MPSASHPEEFLTIQLMSPAAELSIEVRRLQHRQLRPRSHRCATWPMINMKGLKINPEQFQIASTTTNLYKFEVNVEINSPVMSRRIINNSVICLLFTKNFPVFLVMGTDLL
jgi:hypothetical protein